MSGPSTPRAVMDVRLPALKVSVRPSILLAAEDLVVDDDLALARVERSLRRSRRRAASRCAPFTAAPSRCITHVDGAGTAEDRGALPRQERQLLSDEHDPRNHRSPRECGVELPWRFEPT